MDFKSKTDSLIGIEQWNRIASIVHLRLAIDAVHHCRLILLVVRWKTKIFSKFPKNIKPLIAAFHRRSHFGTSTAQVSSGLSAYKSFTSSGFRLPNAQTELNHHMVWRLMKEDCFSGDLFLKMNAIELLYFNKYQWILLMSIGSRCISKSK